MSESAQLSPELLELIRTLPAVRHFEHCDRVFSASPFDIYAACPQCGKEIKIRSFSDTLEVEDIFDAVFKWIEANGTDDIVMRRREEIRKDMK